MSFVTKIFSVRVDVFNQTIFITFQALVLVLLRFENSVAAYKDMALNGYNNSKHC